MVSAAFNDSKRKVTFPEILLYFFTPSTMRWNASFVEIRQPEGFSGSGNSFRFVSRIEISAYFSVMLCFNPMTNCQEALLVRGIIVILNVIHHHFV